MGTNELSDLQKKVLYEGHTERPFSGTYDNFFEKGIYVDPITGNVLFSSLDKFDAGCGWPAFSKPVETGELKETLDTSLGMERTEVRSESSNGHLGHVFSDGPKDKGGLRYCINSAALKFIPYDQLEEQGYTEYKKIFDQ